MGKLETFFFDISRGVDNRPVNPYRERKSIGKETTLAVDLDDINEMTGILQRLSEKVCLILKDKKVRGHTVTLKIKYFNFKSITRSITLKEAIYESTDVMYYISKLIQKTEAGKIKIRLLGISVSNLIN